jgi:hypothetical protein
MQVETLAKQYIHLKSQIKDLEDQLASVKLDITRYLEENNKTKVVTSLYIIDKRPMQMEHIHKQDVPETLWKQYAKRQHHMCLYVRNIPVKSSRTRQRSRSR